MFFINSNNDSVTGKDIKKFVSRLSFWQSVNLLMSAWYIDNPDGKEEDAYNYAIDNAVEEEKVEFVLGKIINFGVANK
ncbi:hypothetical protein [Liquorilactobacillus satsumensis]|uniref:hypothetical protein n=1 Tax=Liquorilactobacillus satsumensis TaxID=259059 RepID=UPI0039E7643F